MNTTILLVVQEAPRRSPPRLTAVCAGSGGGVVLGTATPASRSVAARARHSQRWNKFASRTHTCTPNRGFDTAYD